MGVSISPATMRTKGTLTKLETATSVSFTPAYTIMFS